MLKYEGVEQKIQGGMMGGGKRGNSHKRRKRKRKNQVIMRWKTEKHISPIEMTHLS